MTLKARPAIILKKSLINIGNIILMPAPFENTRYTANSRPHSKPTNTQVVDIGKLLYSLKTQRIIA